MASFRVTILGIYQGFELHSTESDVVEWAIAEIRKTHPKYKFRDIHKYGFFAHDTTSYVEDNFKMLAMLLKDGWEPFAFANGDYHLRKPFDV